MPTRNEPQDPHATLGVDRAASFDEIRAAFRARAKALHPDKNRIANTAEEFRRLHEAYAALRREKGKVRSERKPPPPPAEDAAAAPPPVAEEPVAAPGRWRAGRVAVAAGVVVAVAWVAWWTPQSGQDVEEPPPALVKFEQEMETAMARAAVSFLAPPPEPTHFEMRDREGRKVMVARADYLRIGPVYERLSIEASRLQKRKAEMESRRAGLEEEQRALAPSNVVAVVEFRTKVDAFNRDGTGLRRAFEQHAQEVAELFAQIDRLAQPQP